MITLRNVQVVEGVSRTFEYVLSHSTPGREGTTLSVPLQLCIRKGSASCTIDVGAACGESPDESLAKMASWLRRLAEALGHRDSITIPMG